MKSYVLGMDVGGTNVRLGLVDDSYQAYHVEKLSSRAFFGEPDPLTALAEKVDEYLHRYLGNQRPAMVCAGLPAVLDRDRRRVLSATNFPGMENRDVVDAISNVLEVPVKIEHDAYYLLAYDLMHAGIPNIGTTVGCYFGTGLGNAIFINGTPYIGRNGTACELGHMPVPLNRRPCSCGNAGCIEMFSCGKALERLAEEEFPGEYIGDLFMKHADSEVLQHFVEYMAAAVATEVNILDPDVMFVGGGLPLMEGFPQGRMREMILANTRKPLPAANLSLHFSRPSPENGIIGAAVEGFRLLKAAK